MPRANIINLPLMMRGKTVKEAVIVQYLWQPPGWHFCRCGDCAERDARPLTIQARETSRCIGIKVLPLPIHYMHRLELTPIREAKSDGAKHAAPGVNIGASVCPFELPDTFFGCVHP